MPNTLQTIVVIKTWPLDASGAEELVLFSSVPWSTDNGDIPDSQPALTRFRERSFSVGAKWWRQQSDGLLLTGGVLRQSALNVILDNPRNEDDYTSPLDSVKGYTWTGARAEVWSAQVTPGADGRPTTRIALSSFVQRETLRVKTFSFGSPDATLSLEAPRTFEVESTPFILHGYGYAAQGLISRDDHSALRTTGDFTLRVSARQNNLVAPFSDYQLVDMPLQRLYVDTSNDLRWEIRNAAGSWQQFAAITSLSSWDTFHITYTSSDTTAKLYFNGAYQETLVITSGLYASAGSQTTRFIAYSTDWHAAGAHHLSSALLADEISADWQRGVEFHPDMTMGFNFNEAVGNTSYDIAGNQDADISSVTWAPTDEGDAHLAGQRLPALVGMAFGAPALTFNATDSRIVPGYAGGRQLYAWVAEDGHRLKTGEAKPSVARVINATRDTISPVPSDTYTQDQSQFAVGQSLVRSPAGGAGNPTTFTVSAVLIHPILNNAEVSGSIKTSTNQTADESSSFSVDDNSDNDYTDGSFTLTRGGSTYPVPAATLSSAPTGQLQIGIARNDGDASETAIEHVCENFGPELTPTVTHEHADTELWHHGWTASGDAPFRDLADQIALSSLSVDDAPLFVGFEADGDIEVYGARLDADSDDFTVLTWQIKDIVEEPLDARPLRVVVQYAQNGELVEPAESLADNDSLLRELQREWRKQESGSGDAVGYFDSSLLRQQDAYSQAVALVRIQKGSIYRVDLQSPVPDATIRAVRAGRQTTITWNKNANWDSGVTALVVGYEAGIESLAFWVWAEL